MDCSPEKKSSLTRLADAGRLTVDYMGKLKSCKPLTKGGQNWYGDSMETILVLLWKQMPLLQVLIEIVWALHSMDKFDRVSCSFVIVLFSVMCSYCRSCCS